MFLMPMSAVGFGAYSAVTGYEPAGALYFDGSADYLKFIPSSTTGNKKFTFSCWLKKATVSTAGGHGTIFSAWTDNNNRSGITIEDTGFLDLFSDVGGSRHSDLHTVSKYYDPTAWFNLILVYDSTVSTPSGSSIFYMINGTKVVESGYGALDAHTYPSQNQVTQWLTAGTEMVIGMNGYNSTPQSFYTGYIADAILLDGIVSTDGSEFGETSSSGIWVPKDPSGLTYGNNGFWLDFGDGSDVGRDASTSVTKITSATYIGDMTSSGGLKAAFNNAVEGQSSSAKTGAAASYYIGQDHGSGNSKIVTGFRLFGPNDARFSNNATHTLKLYGSDSAPSNNTDGTQLWTGSLDDTASSGTIKEVNSSITTTTGYRYHWITVTDSDSGGSNAVSELQLFEGGTDLPNSFFPFSVNASNIVVDGPADSDTKEITIYPVIDPAGPWGVAENTLSDNNMTWISGASSNKFNYSTLPVSNTDKVYFEVHQSGNCGGSHTPGFGITKYGHPGGDTYPGGQTDNSDWGCYIGTGSTTTGVDIKHDASNATGQSGATLTNQAGGADGDVYMCARDGVNLWFGRNGTWYDSGDPTSASTAIFASSRNPLPTDEPLWVSFHSYGTQANLTWKPYSKDWSYSPPSGFGEMKSTITGIGNAATLDPLQFNGTISEGNLKHTADTSGYLNASIGTVSASSGKFYHEIDFVSGTIDDSTTFGVVNVGDLAATRMDQNSSHYVGHANGGGWAYKPGSTPKKWTNSTQVNYGVNATDGDTLQVYTDLDNGKLYFGKNGTLMNSANLTNGTGFAYDTLSGHIVPAFGIYNGDVIKVRFSPEDWLFTPGHSDYKAWSTQNIAEPTVTDPSAYYNTILYNGSNSSPYSVTGIADSSGATWTPDFVWLKQGTSTNRDHYIFDSVRGVEKAIHPSYNGAEDSTLEHGKLTDFDDGGFELSDGSSSGNSVKENGGTFVAWCMKAGGAPSADNTGDRTPTNNSVMKGGVAQTASNYFESANIYPKRMSIADHGGFSIILYTANNTANQTIPHGLDREPDFIIEKDLGRSQAWNTHTPRGLYYGPLSGDSAFVSSTKPFAAEPTSAASGDATNLITLWDGAGSAYTNDGTTDHILYCFAKTPGLIGIGKYTGGGSGTYPHIICDDGASGFKPAFLMVKRTDSDDHWYLGDGARNPYNPLNKELYANIHNTEATQDVFDFTSSGFKVRNHYAMLNASGGTYIYLAFAEQPFGLNNRAR